MVYDVRREKKAIHVIDFSDTCSIFPSEGGKVKIKECLNEIYVNHDDIDNCILALQKAKEVWRE